MPKSTGNPYPQPTEEQEKLHFKVQQYYDAEDVLYVLKEIGINPEDVDIAYLTDRYHDACTWDWYEVLSELVDDYLYIHKKG